MNIKIGNTQIVDNLCQVDFTKSKIGNQLMIVDQYNHDYLFGEEETDGLDYDQYLSYVVTDTRFDNVLVNLYNFSTNLDIGREYDDTEDEEGNIIPAPRTIYTVADIKCDDDLCMLSYKGKNISISDKLSFRTVPPEENDTNLSNKFIRKVMNEEIGWLNEGKSYKYINSKNDDEYKYFYDYAIVNLSSKHERDGLKMAFFLKTTLKKDKARFDSDFYVMIFKGNEYVVLNNSKGNTAQRLFNFIYKNEKSSKELVANLKEFETTLSIFKYDYFAQLQERSKRSLKLMLIDYEISFDEYDKMFEPIYECDEFKCYLNVSSIAKFRDSLLYIKDGKQTTSYYVEDKDAAKICNELLEENWGRRELNTRTGKVNDEKAICIYSDANSKVLKCKSSGSIDYYYVLKGYYIKLDTSYAEQRGKIEEIRERMQMFNKLEEE